MVRFTPLILAVAGALSSIAFLHISAWLGLSALLFLALTVLGIWDLFQSQHSILRNYPIIGHMRWVFEGIRPEIRQYLIESDQDEEPFSRDERSIVYQRAKNEEDKRPFGTKRDVYEPGYAWLTHSIAGKHIEDSDFRVAIGGPDCRQGYSASIYNISAMSFGALSGNAILALNTGARLGNFAHDTGEGGISRFHREGNGDLIYEVGTGYFGCRDAAGHFDSQMFAEQAANAQVRMIEVKLSQGAKPGHGGMLPAAKISPEIAAARGVPMDVDCISPPAHTAFTTPVEFCEFLGRLRELSEGKPVGFKLCVGHRREFMCMVKAMIETGIVPDFIVVDGTGAAPLEFTNHIGMPLIEGLTFVHNTLLATGLRDRIKLGASGKLVTSFDIARACALGADWCNSARGFMFAIGCIQTQACHTNQCPTGVATQDAWRQRALDPRDKATRVYHFHRNTLRAVADIVGAAGLTDPAELRPRHFNVRLTTGEAVTGDVAFPELPPGCLMDGRCEDDAYVRRWELAAADSFAAPV